MKKYLVGVVLSIGILVSPAFTQAAVLTDSQVQAILSLLSSFGADQSVINNVQASLTGGTPTTTRQAFCHNFNRDLTVGSSGDDVSALNQALSSSGIDTTGNNSDFDEDNAGDVVRFQAKYGIRQTGYVGPLTRAKLNALYRCSTASFSASPTYGTAPLSVRFTTSGLNPNGIYEIYFGDGTTSGLSQAGGGFDTIHNYTSPGTYTAQLTKSSPCTAPAGAVCVLAPQEILGTATITVTDSNSNLSAPVVNGIDGPASLSVGQSGTWTVNASVPNNPGAQLSYSVLWGDEAYGASMLGASQDSRLQTSATFTHTYNYGGTYKPKFTVSNSAGSASAEVTVAVGAQPVASFSEQVKCVFNGATTEQKCWGELPTKANWVGRYGCTGVGTCVATVKGWPNAPMTWGSSCGGSSTTVIDGNNEYANFSCGTSSSGITVTAPNGGEQWEIGQLNTITWSPYDPNNGVNPSSDVKAYLEKKVGDGFNSVYEIIPSGKASIHWEGQVRDMVTNAITYPTPGQYYVHVINNKKWVGDWSDAPFTLLPRAVDIKINTLGGWSDGPVSLSDLQRINLSWTTSPGMTNCRISSVHPSLNETNVFSIAVAPNGNREAYYSGYAGSSIGLTCQKNDEASRSDYVYVNSVASSASLQITSPNRGEIFKVNEVNKISWLTEGIESSSIALYKNDQWVAWIVKDLHTIKSCDPKGNCEFFWNPSSPTLTYGLGDTLNQSIYKIYITGQKADGTGYVDDKSDAPFGFVSNTTPAPTLSLTANPASITAGQSSTISWSSTNATSCVAPDSSALSGNVIAVPSQTNTYNVTCTGPGGSVTKSVTINVTTTPAPTLTLTANPTSVYSGQSTTLTWSSTNATSCVAPDSSALSGNVTAAPSQTNTYDVTCTGPGGSVTQSVTVTVTAAAAKVTYDKPFYAPGGTISATWSNFTPSSAYDWIGVVIAGSGWGSVPEYQYISGQGVSWFYTGGTASGTKTLVAPKTVGTYELVYFQNNGTQPFVRSSPFTATSQTASALSAVDGLMARNPASQTQASFKYFWDKDLQIGSPYPGDIKALQTALMKEGVYAGEITGGFYNQTYTAVKDFQTKYGINATGYVGFITRARLNELYSR